MSNVQLQGMWGWGQGPGSCVYGSGSLDALSWAAAHCSIVWFRVTLCIYAQLCGRTDHKTHNAWGAWTLFHAPFVRVCVGVWLDGLCLMGLTMLPFPPLPPPPLYLTPPHFVQIRTTLCMVWIKTCMNLSLRMEVLRKGSQDRRGVTLRPRLGAQQVMRLARAVTRLHPPPRPPPSSSHPGLHTRTRAARTRAPLPAPPPLQRPAAVRPLHVLAQTALNPKACPQSSSRSIKRMGAHTSAPDRGPGPGQAPGDQDLGHDLNQEDPGLGPPPPGEGAGPGLVRGRGHGGSARRRATAAASGTATRAATATGTGASAPAGNRRGMRARGTPRMRPSPSPHRPGGGRGR